MINEFHTWVFLTLRDQYNVKLILINQLPAKVMNVINTQLSVN